MSSSAPVIVALDFDNQHAALSLAEQLDPTQCRLKVGKELFTAAGPTLVKALVERNFDVFLDLKFHDIPNTAAKAVSAAADLGVWMANVHASGGSRMMSAAREALETAGQPNAVDRRDSADQYGSSLICWRLVFSAAPVSRCCIWPS